jgi:hypothetical protein
MTTTTAPTPADLAAATPAQIDAQLSGIWEMQASLRLRMKNARTSLGKLQQRKERQQARGTWFCWDDQELADLEARIYRMRRALADLDAEAEPFEAEFTRRGGWPRYFKVIGDGGHVHNGTRCQSCFPTTQFVWLVDLAGKDEAAMVEKWGHVACTICFKSAPVQEMAAAAKAAKNALYCPGSGQSPRGKIWPSYPSYKGNCPCCNKGVPVTAHGMLRKHKATT